MRIAAPRISARILRNAVFAVVILIACAIAVRQAGSPAPQIEQSETKLPAGYYPHTHTELIGRAELKANGYQWLAAIVLTNAVVIGGMLWGGGSSYQRIAANSGKIREADVSKVRDEVAFEKRQFLASAERKKHDVKIEQTLSDLSLEMHQMASDLVLLNFKVERLSVPHWEG